MEHDLAVYAWLTDRYAALAADATPDERWRWLMAAHVAGQLRLRTHWDSHCRMLALAWETRDGAEVAGQLLRLALVPVGHALGRLPLGNVGRATVPALRPMTPPRDVQALLRRAVSAAHDRRLPGG